MSQNAVPRKATLVGMLRVARGRADGIACFGATPQAFLSSLAPLLAFPLVGSVLALFNEGPRKALTGLAMTLCALLTPAVISYELARIWNRAGAWTRFATAFNWCEWILPILACLIMVPLSFAISAGMSAIVAGRLLVLCLGLYGLWLHWFLARRGLGLSALKAIGMVIVVNLGTMFAVAGPRLLAHHFG